MGRLTVILDKMTDLKDTDGPMNHPDPYVIFHLEQDNLILDKNYGKQESSVKKCTCNPHYNETFTFENVESLKNLELNIKVYDQDFGRDDAMGKKNIKLEDLTPGEETEFVEKLDKDGKGLFRASARIYLKVKYDEE
mmetsp:Transcript_1468/g.2550  ORF Transcript_1468/g.2550 Transcript_1468/m.2550 type:complete len:137 (-) Transcript_1468:114-524(-)